MSSIPKRNWNFSSRFHACPTPPGPDLGGHCIPIDPFYLTIAYKKNVDDVRESPAAEIMELLRERGALLSYADPHVPAFPKMREHSFDLKAVPANAETLGRQDCVLLVTDHDAFDYDAIAKHARLLVDTRGRYPKPSSNIVKA